MAFGVVGVVKLVVRYIFSKYWNANFNAYHFILFSDESAEISRTTWYVPGIL